MIKIIVENLTIEGVRFTGEEPASFIILSEDDPFEISNPIKYDFVASLAANDVIVRGTAKTTIKGECCTCLETCEVELEHKDICCYFENPGQGELDISNEFREEISLNLPSSIYCSDQCKGLCQVCGQNLNKEQCDGNYTPEQELPEENIWNDIDNLEIDN